MDDGLKIVALGNEFNSLNCQAWAGLGASYAIADDRESSIWNDYGNGVIPRNVIIDSEGVVRYNALGFNETAITNVLNELLSTTGTNPSDALPDQYDLLAVYPNPFNGETQIQFELPAEGRVELLIYDGTGRVVRKLLSTELSAGSHSVSWNARDDQGSEIPSGVYITSLFTGSRQLTEKVLLLK